MKNQKLCGVVRADCTINHTIFIGYINIVLPDFKGEKIECKGIKVEYE